MIFGISDTDFLDKNKIKVIDGIAGAGKSSAIDTFLISHGLEYGRYTSTHRLRRDAEARYNMKCFTIAGGLFTTDSGRFYQDLKEVDYPAVVIDEVLQSSSKVFKWARENVGKLSIIMTTDSKQMLSVGQKWILRNYEDFIKEDNVIYTELTQTRRARTPETEEAFIKLYRSDSNDCNMFYQMQKQFKHISYDDLEFSPDNYYVTHTNLIEEDLYRRFDIASRDDIELIPKGTIASKDMDYTPTYPILPQHSAESRKVASYWQASNVGSAVRFQGSEVKQGETLYFIISDHSKVSNREWYTVLTRCWDINSIIIVDSHIHDDNFTTFFNRQVKRPAFLTTDSINGIDKKKGTISDIFLDQILDKKQNDNYHYDRNHIYYHGEVYIRQSYYSEDTKFSKKSTAYSLIKKEDKMDYPFMIKVMRELEERGIDCIKYASVDNRDAMTRDKYEYQIDLYSAYPHILKYEKIPTDRIFTTDYNSNLLNFYLYRGNKITDNCIIEERLANYLKDQGEEVYYLFSTSYQIGSKMGDKLIDKAYKSIEDKAEVKEVHWGFYQKRFLEHIVPPKGGEDYYVIREQQKYEIIMVAMKSYLTYMMLQLKDKLGGAVVVDALFFSPLGTTTQNNQIENNIQGAKDIMQMFPNYDYRIKDMTYEIEKDGKWVSPTLYQTYVDLPTRKERNRQHHKEHMRQSRLR